MKVIFLDVDGVLLTRESYMRENVGTLGGNRNVFPPPRCVSELNRVTDTTGAKIVVSSVWRMFPDIISILEGCGVKAEIVGLTPQLSGAARGREIQTWLNGNQVEAFAILDDDRDMVHLMPYLIHTSMEGGLTAKHADDAITLLTVGTLDT